MARRNCSGGAYELIQVLFSQYGQLSMTQIFRLSPASQSSLRVVIVIAAVVSLVGWPAPLALTLGCVLLGCIAAGLRLMEPDGVLSDFLYALIFMIAIVEAPDAAHHLRPEALWPRWQPVLTFLAAQAAMGELVWRRRSGAVPQSRSQRD